VYLDKKKVEPSAVHLVIVLVVLLEIMMVDLKVETKVLLLAEMMEVLKG
jgi:hypothetical protein